MENRISTSLAQQLGINSIMFQQAKVNQTQQQISSGKRILTPSDDPAAAAQLLDLSQSLSRLGQFQDNLQYAQSRLSLSEGTLQAVTDSIHRVRELAVQGFNATNTAEDKQSIAEEMFQRLDEIIALANTKDANGDYIYAGFKAQTEPVSGSSQTGTFTFNGDQGERYLKIGESRMITDGNSGAEVFFDLVDKDGNAESLFQTVYGLATDLANNKPAQETMTLNLDTVPIDGETVTVNGVVYEFDIAGDGVAAAVPPAVQNTQVLPATTPAPTAIEVIDALKAAINASDTGVSATGTSPELILTADDQGADELTFSDGTGTPSNLTVTNPISIPLYDHLDQLDTALERILNVRSQTGARLNVLDSQNETNQDFRLSIESTKSQIEDLDMAEAISRFNLQIVSLQAAQQAFIKVQGLSLFNHL